MESRWVSFRYLLICQRLSDYILLGFMKHLPNLLKQESSSAATLVHVLLRMYYDDRSAHEAARPQIAKQLMPSVFFVPFLSYRILIMASRLGLGVLQDYSKLRADTQVKNIVAWTPVVAEILEGFCRFDDKAVSSFSAILWMFSCWQICTVRKISASNIPFGDSTSVTRHGTRDSAGFENVFRSSWFCAGFSWRKLVCTI